MLKYGSTLIYYDTAGNTLWSRVFMDPIYDDFRINDMFAINNSAFYIVGSCRKTLSMHERNQGFLAKFDAKGDSILYIIYPDTINRTITDIGQFIGDTLLLCSSLRYGFEDEKRIMVEKIDTNGIVLSRQVGNQAMKYPHQVLKAPHDYIFVAGNKTFSSGNSEIFIDVHDLNLNHLYTIYPTQLIGESFINMVYFNNKVYITYLKYLFSNQSMICRISRLSSGGAAMQTVNVGDEVSFEGSGKTVVLNDNCLVVPLSSFGYNPYNNRLYMVDSLLNEVCYTDLYYPLMPYYFQHIQNIAVIPGNKIAVTGFIEGEPPNPLFTQDHWNIITTDLMGFMNTHCNTTVGSEEIVGNTKVNEDFSIYPNPTDDILQIESNSSDAEFEVRIYNYTGELMGYSKGEHRISLGLNDLPEGIYLLKISTNGIQYSGKFVKN